MASFRDIKRRARADVHLHMRVRAFYLADRNAAPVQCFVRVHTKFQALGDQAGTNLNYAEREDVTPRIILWREELPQPSRNAIISVEAGEAYQIDNVLPADDLTITAMVTRMDLADTTDLPVPGVL
ncbi:hypothetical protein [Rhizobium nepotum]|uniref:hypothetical protein n=1 Tax=Rhizobium nepotum TaxID=1035271 RepID=UPI003CF18735